jgi:hypothetical protein
MVKYTVLLVLLCVLQASVALIHDLKISDDNRNKFVIETFGFDVGGEYHMKVLNFKVSDPPCVSI